MSENRFLDYTQVVNFRDLGGYTGHEGKTVQWGQLYRSGYLGRLNGEELQRFADLGIRTVIDLRYDFEIARRGRVPEIEGLAFHHLSIEHEPYNQAVLGAEIDAVTYLAEKYHEVAVDGVVEIRQVLEVLAAATEPALFHCAAGKDRTGIIAALVLSILGVSEEDIIADFALTNRATERLRGDFLALRPGLEYLWPGYGTAPAGLMRLFLSKLKAEHGSVKEYLDDAVKLPEQAAHAMRARLLG